MGKEIKTVYRCINNGCPENYGDGKCRQGLVYRCAECLTLRGLVNTTRGIPSYVTANGPSISELARQVEEDQILTNGVNNQNDSGNYSRI